MASLTSPGREEGKPGPETIRAFRRHFYNLKAELQPVAYENIRQQCWRFDGQILLPLESDDEELKPHRFIFAALDGLERHGGGDTYTYEFPTAGDCTYASREDQEKYFGEGKGYFLDRVNGYGWGMLIFPYRMRDHKPASQCRKIYEGVDMLSDVNMLEELSLLSDNLHEDLEDRLEIPESQMISTSFIGRRGTVQDWADSVVWSDEAGVQDADVGDATLLAMYRHLLQLRKPIQGAEIHSQLVHLNLYKYAGWRVDSSGSRYVGGFFDPSTLFWRPAMYARAMYFVDALLDGWVADESDRVEFVETLQRFPVDSQFLIRAFLFRLLILSKEQDTGTAGRRESFTLRFKKSLEVVEPFL